MRLNITAKNIEMTGALKRFVEDKFEKITKFLPKMTSAHVVLSVEKYRHSAEVIIEANGQTFLGREVSADMYLSIDKVMSTIERRARKYREKIWTMKRTKPRREVNPSDEMATGFRAMNPTHLSPAIVKTRRFAIKPMSLEEAVMQMGLVEDGFLVFSNATTGQVNVIYRRKDGNYGLIEPIFE